MEQFKCSQCANQELQFVNLPYQEKKQPIAFMIILVLSLLVFVFSLPTTVYFLFATFADVTNVVALVLCGWIALVSGIVSFVCYAILKLIPPDTYSDLCYVCSKCGRVESVLRD